MTKLRLILLIIFCLAASVLVGAAQFQIGDRSLVLNNNITVSDNFSTANCGDSNFTQIASVNLIIDDGAHCLSTGYGAYAMNSTTVNGYAYWSANSFSAHPNQYSQATIGSLVIAGTSGWVSVNTRMSGSTAGYFCMVYNTGSAVNSTMYACSTVTSCNIISGGGVFGTGPSYAAGDVVRIEVTGSSVSCKKNGTVVLGPITDSTLTSGQPGIGGGGTGYGGAAIAKNWQAGSL